MKKLLFLTAIFTFTLMACTAQVPPFEKVVTFKAGFQFNANGPIYYSIPSVGEADWLTLKNKPQYFPTLPHTHRYEDIIDQPDIISLKEALDGLGYLPIPERTTEEINATIPDKSGVVKDVSLNVYKLWDTKTKTWSKLVITNW